MTAPVRIDEHAVRVDIDQLTENLSVIADWRDEIRRMLIAALNPFDVAPDLDWLRTEVERFKLGCKGARP